MDVNQAADIKTAEDAEATVEIAGFLRLRARPLVADDHFAQDDKSWKYHF